MPKNSSDKANDAVENEKPATAAAAFFQDAYDNPGTTALVVGGTVATIGLIAASRGKLARLMPGGGRDGILLVEDTPFMGKAFKHALEEQGEKVTWFTGVKKLNPFTGITHEGKEVVVQPNKFKFAFVDGDLKGSIPQGEHVVDALKSSRLTSFGTSSVHQVNESLLRNGATVTGDKPAILSALVNRTIDLRQVVKAPARVQVQMDDMMTSMRAGGMRAETKKAEAVIRKYLYDEPL